MRRTASWMLALFSLSAPVHARESGEKRLVIGEISSQVVRLGTNFESLVRAASEEEISALDLRSARAGRQVIVSVSLVRLDTKADSPTTDATCKVSASLRDARGGAIFAVLEAQARATSTAARDAVESSAVHGALHAVLARIPEALRR